MAVHCIVWVQNNFSVENWPHKNQTAGGHPNLKDGVCWWAARPVTWIQII